jgi:hypothetical protein
LGREEPARGRDLALSLSDPLYGVSREEAVKKAAKKVAEEYAQPAREKKSQNK